MKASPFRGIAAAMPSPFQSQHLRTALRLLAALAIGAAPLVATAGGARHANGSAEAAYQRERAACLAGQTSQDRATCLKEAGAALAESRRGTLDKGLSDAERAQNKLQRCQLQSADKRADCERLARGEGSTQGSVEGGGVIKELVTRSVGNDAAAEPGTAASR